MLRLIGMVAMPSARESENPHPTSCQFLVSLRRTAIGIGGTPQKTVHGTESASTFPVPIWARVVIMRVVMRWNMNFVALIMVGTTSETATRSSVMSVALTACWAIDELHMATKVKITEVASGVMSPGATPTMDATIPKTPCDTLTTSGGLLMIGEAFMTCIALRTDRATARGGSLVMSVGWRTISASSRNGILLKKGTMRTSGILTRLMKRSGNLMRNGAGLRTRARSSQLIGGSRSSFPFGTLRTIAANPRSSPNKMTVGIRASHRAHWTRVRPKLLCLS